MARDRVPLETDEEDDDEPLVASADELRERMDKSHMPDEPETERERAHRRLGREERVEREREIEEEAVDRMVEKLREKGKSRRWIESHMDEIRERVRTELYGD